VRPCEAQGVGAHDARREAQVHMAGPVRGARCRGARRETGPSHPDRTFWQEHYRKKKLLRSNLAINECNTRGWKLELL
jgi:hypothetical protein